MIFFRHNLNFLNILHIEHRRSIDAISPQFQEINTGSPRKKIKYTQESEKATQTEVKKPKTKSALCNWLNSRKISIDIDAMAEIEEGRGEEIKIVEDISSVEEKGTSAAFKTVKFNTRNEKSWRAKSVIVYFYFHHLLGRKRLEYTSEVFDVNVSLFPFYNVLSVYIV